MEFLNIFGDRLDIKRADLELLRWTPPSNHSIPVIETDNDFWLGWKLDYTEDDILIQFKDVTADQQVPRIIQLIISIQFKMSSWIELISSNAA